MDPGHVSGWDMLCVLIPVNDAAHTIFNDTREQGGVQLVKLDKFHGIGVRLQSYRQHTPIRLLHFGYPSPKYPPGVCIKNRNYSRLHCSIDIKACSGELILKRMAATANVYLDRIDVSGPPERALIFGESRELRIGPALFCIAWPKIADASMQEYLTWKRKSAQGRKRIWEKYYPADVGTTNAEEREVSYTDDVATTNAEEREEAARQQRGISQHPDLAEDATEPHSGPPPHLYRSFDLGSGGFGTVYLAVDRIAATQMAVKEIRVSDEDLKYTYREVKMHLNRKKALTHKHILRAYDWREVPGRKIQIDLEYCPEGHLGTHLDEARADIARVLRQVASGLEYLHDRKPGILHRDIKPRNILVTMDAKGELELKLADFGNSNYIRSSRSVGCGSREYRAPEVMEGGDDGEDGDCYTEKADIYSLGVMILTILGALDGWEEDLPMAKKTYQKIIRRAEKFASTKPWGQLLMEMTSKDPAKRPSATSILARLETMPKDLAKRPSATDELAHIPDELDHDMTDAPSSEQACSGAGDGGGRDTAEEDEGPRLPSSDDSVTRISEAPPQVVEDIRASDRRLRQYGGFDTSMIHQYLLTVPDRRKPNVTKQDSSRQ